MNENVSTARRISLGVIYSILMLGFIVTIWRFAYGLGAVTALNDHFPWGLWIGFDVMTGVALAAGGFTISATVYIFNLKKYKPVLKPAILTAFLGYTLVVVGLAFDLGRPLRIWHPLIYWNYHSVLFEVGWCVMLYSTVLALEFAPVIFERLGYKITNTLKRLIEYFMIPLVIAGVILSTLHQSSLGSLYLIVPNKLHEFWFTRSLPYLFYVSAIAVGLSMVIFESFISSKVFRRSLENEILEGLAKASSVVLGIYFIFKVIDLLSRVSISSIFTSGFMSLSLMVELIACVLVPAILYSMKKMRENPNVVFLSATLVVIGVILNRLNVSIIGMSQAAKLPYFPSWMEITITLSIIAAGLLVFRLAVTYLSVFPEGHMARE